MPKRFALIPLTALALLALAACQDGQFSAPKTSPPGGPSGVLGMLQGTVDGNTMTTTFIPLGNSPAVDGNFSPAIYGNQGSTVSVSGVVDSLHDVANVSRTWFLHVRIRNLLGYPIGSNWNAAASPDTTGVFVFFSSLPVVTLPSPCSGCTVNVNNPAGSANFTVPGQKYFWYKNRPTAVQGSPGTDTTDYIVWQFKTTSFTAPDTAHAFTFVLLVSAEWPPPNETTWSTKYDGTNDSLPDTQAEPRWRKFAALFAPTLGSEVWTAGTELVLTAGNNSTSIYQDRRDSLGLMSAVMDAKVRVPTVAAGEIQAVFGVAEPLLAGGRQAFIGVASDRVSFVNFSDFTGQWSANGGTFALDGTTYHSYRLRKIGTASAALCVDGVATGLTRTYAQLQGTTFTFFLSSTAFGMDGRVGGAESRWTSVLYTIGSDGGGC